MGQQRPARSHRRRCPAGSPAAGVCIIGSTRGDVGIAAAEVVVVVDVAEEELRRRPRAADRAGSGRSWPPAAPPASAAVPAASAGRCAARAPDRAAPGAQSQAARARRRTWTSGVCGHRAGMRGIGACKQSRPAIARPAEPHRLSRSPHPLHSPHPRDARLHAVTPFRPATGAHPPRPPRRSAWPSPAAARSAACTNSARCARSTRRSTAST